MAHRDLDRNSALQDLIKAAVSGGRMTKPEEVKDIIVFLCSPAASYVNGTELVINTGVTLTNHMV